MHTSGIDNLFWILSDAGQALLLGILFRQRLHKIFPIFSIYLLWQLISDLVFFLLLSFGHGISQHTYIDIYFSLIAVADLLELGVLVEIAANVLRPARSNIQRTAIYFLLGTMAFVAVGAFFAAAYAHASTLSNSRTFTVMDTTAAILRLITFLLVAGFSQLLGLSWKNHVLQLASGLAFFSIIVLIGQLAQSQLHTGPLYASRYHAWAQFESAGYLCTLYFWCYVFLKKEAPRKEFSPQMAQLLVLLSGGAKRQHAVLARSRDD